MYLRDNCAFGLCIWIVRQCPLHYEIVRFQIFTHCETLLVCYAKLCEVEPIKFYLEVDKTTKRKALHDMKEKAKGIKAKVGFWINDKKKACGLMK